MSNYYRGVETDFGTILQQLVAVMTPEELKEVSQFVDVGEYGVAFEALCMILREKKVAPEKSLRVALHQLGEVMGIDRDYWSEL
jgi:hypothetical protein